MLKPQTAESGGTRGAELKAWYLNTRDEYLGLCYKYDLPPKDITLSHMGNGEFEANDRIRLIKLLVELREIEKLLAPGQVKDLLFTEDEALFVNSAIFFNPVH